MGIKEKKRKKKESVTSGLSTYFVTLLFALLQRLQQWGIGAAEAPLAIAGAHALFPRWIPTFLPVARAGLVCERR